MPNGISSGTAQLAAKLALHEACKVALAGQAVDIAFGFRWPFVENDWAAVVDTDSDIDAKNVGPSRQQDETITLTMSIGSWVAGDDTATEIAAATRAFGILTKIQDHIRKNDITLGGTVLWCLPGRSSSAGATTDEESGFGRLTEISATFVCSHRIRNI